MSIIKQQKVTLFGLYKEKQRLLEGLQSLGCMHIIPLVPPPKEVEKIVSPRAEKVYKALKFLSRVESKRRQIHHKKNFDVDTLVDQTLNLQLKIRHATDKKALIEKRLIDIQPWGNINYPPEKTLAGYRFWYYIVPLAKRKLLNKVSVPWSIVHVDNKFAYTVLIAKNEPKSELMPVPRTHLGSLSKHELLNALEETELLLDELHSQRHGLTRFVYLLTVNIAEADDRAALANASQKVLEDPDLVAIQGWVPVDTLDQVHSFANELGIACLIEKPGKNETPPTLLKQPKSMSAAKDLAMFYQVPGYFGWDPSWLLFGSFSLFFAMILADAGYGLLLLAGILIYWKRLSSNPRAKAYRNLGLSLTICTVVYGMLVGSYFGITPHETSFLSQFHLLNVNNFDLMMKLSIIIGALHIGIANISMAYIYRHRRVALAKLGWLAVIYAGLVYWLAAGNQAGLMASYSLFAIGGLAIVLFSSERPINKMSDHLLRILDGLFSLKNLLNAFGDVLSYMRLFALGLASASLAITFNNLASNAYHSIAGGGLLIAILILLIGHALNLVLSLMSGVVHGLRLNYIEFYNWGQAEEGVAFQRFARKEIKE